ncbi:uncharacterized protein LOC116409807 [Xenopus tropicalis]|uniref:Uncharacterized protein LOC116409807 n=1 Tax=Xenopus tropicalis TaxID=8364 RepID=A0A8J1JBG7_XENTR|nr:uncharacterized protein LOC116409807 [Xenopus tropicalis]
MQSSLCPTVFVLHVLCCGTLSAAQNNMTLKAHKEIIKARVGQPVMIPVTYTLLEEAIPRFPSFKWERNGELLLFFSPQTCYTGLEGSANNCSGEPFLPPGFTNNLTFFPENASLFIPKAQLNDSGMYKLSSRESSDNVSIRLSVYGSEASGQDQDSNLNFTLMTSIILIMKVGFIAVLTYSMRYRRSEVQSEYIQERRNRR